MTLIPTPYAPSAISPADASPPQGYVQIVEHVPSLDIQAGRALVVVRESNEYDLMAFSTMIRQVIEPLAAKIPGAAEVLEASGSKAQIMRQTPEGDALREQWAARVLTQGSRDYGYVFEVRGTCFFFAMTSAFSDATEDLRNTFTDDLIDTANRFLPDHLYTGPSTRLVRRKDLGEHLGRELGLRNIKVHTKEVPDGINPLRDPGSMHWSLLCMQAESDLRTTVTRLLTGRIFHMRNNEWLAGPGSLPLGYSLESEEVKRPVVGDANEVALARLLIQLAAQAYNQLDRTLDKEETAVGVETIIKALSAHGATKRSNRRSDKHGTAIAGTSLQSVSSPKQVVISLLEVLPAYGADGVVRRMQKLPIAGLTQHDVHGMAIYKSLQPGGTEARDEFKSKGSVLFSWTFPKPTDSDGNDEAWASTEELSHAAKYLEHLQVVKEGAPSTKTLWPFSGLFKAENEQSFYHFTHNSGGYQWRVSEKIAYYKGSSAAVGKFDHTLVTTRFVEALLQKLEDEGIDPRQVQVTKPRKVPPDAHGGTRALEAELADLQQRFDAAQRSAREAQSDRSRLQHQAVGDELSLQLDALEAKLAVAAEQISTHVDAVKPDLLEVSSLATLLSVLLDTAGGPTDHSVSEALRRIVISGTITGCWDDASPWGAFSCKVRVPNDRGISRLVNITFEVGNTSQGSDRKGFHRRVARLLALRMTTPLTLDALAPRLGAQPTPAHVGRMLHEAFVPLFTARGLAQKTASHLVSALLDCPIDSTRDIIWRLLHDQELPVTIEDLDAHDTQRHIEELRDHYLSPNFRWTCDSWSAGGEKQRREIARWVAGHTTSMASHDGVALTALATALGMKDVQGVYSKHVYRETSPLRDSLPRLLRELASATTSAAQPLCVRLS